MKQTKEGSFVLSDRWADYQWLDDVLSNEPHDPCLNEGPLFEIGVDVETKTLRKNAKQPDMQRDSLVGIGLGLVVRDANDPYGEDSYIPVYGLATDGYVSSLTRGLRRWPWYAHNAMFDATVLRRYGIFLGEHAGDPRIIAYLLGEPDAGLKELLDRWMQYPTTEYDVLLDYWGAADISEVPVEAQADYCALQDACQCVRLEKYMRPHLNERSLDVYEKIELPMVNILVSMSRRGVRFDREAAQPMWEKEAKAVAGLDAVIAEQVRKTGFIQWEMRNGELWHPTCKVCRNGSKKKVRCEACGGRGKLDPVERPFNPGSSDQVRLWLYDHMGAPVRRYAGGRKEWQAEADRDAGIEVAASTDALALLQLRNFHEVVQLMLTRRKFDKRRSTLAKQLELSAADGRLHTTFTNTKVVSGRLSSKEPNLQNVTLDLRVLLTADP